MPPGMAKAAGAALAGRELRNQREACLHDGYDHQLCNAFADSNGKRGLPPIPTRHQEFTLIIAIDQSDQVAEYDAVFVAQAGTWQHHRRQAGIADMNRHAGWDQVRVARLYRQRLWQAGAQIQASRSGGRVVG